MVATGIDQSEQNLRGLKQSEAKSFVYNQWATSDV